MRRQRQEKSNALTCRRRQKHSLDPVAGERSLVTSSCYAGVGDLADTFGGTPPRADKSQRSDAIANTVFFSKEFLRRYFLIWYWAAYLLLKFLGFGFFYRCLSRCLSGDWLYYVLVW